MTEHDVIPASVEEIDATDEGHWNHLLPVEDWERVVAEADQILEERTAEEGLGGGAELQPLGLTPRRMSFPDTHGKTSGPIVRNQLFVNHTAECPLRTGFAESLTRWGNGGYQPRASWPLFVDPATVVTWVSFQRAAFLHGPANSLGWGWEQAGYARFTRAEWLTPDGLRQLDLLAQEIVRRGIPVDALRWLTNAQVQAIVDRKDTTTRGLCDHRQIDPRNRSDAGDGYPRDVLLTWIRSYHPGVPGQTPPGTPGTVRIGDRGSMVVVVQEYLDALGYDVGKPDGVAGAMFDAALRDFQTRNGLDVDGVAGPDTLTQLRSKEAIMAKISDEDVARIRDAVLWAPARPGATGIGGSSIRNSIGGAAAYSLSTLEIVRELAARQGVDIDEDALSASLAASLAPALKDALEAEIPGTADSEAIADAVVRRLGAALTNNGAAVEPSGYVSGVRAIEDVDQITGTQEA